MNKRILVRRGTVVISALWREKEMIQLDIDETAENAILGNIYIGKVKNIVQNIRAAFVEIGHDQICYYSLEDNPLPIFSKAANGKRVCIGDEIVVQVVKEGIKTKDPVATSRLNLSGRYTVLIHGDGQLAFSRKIKDMAWKREMREKIVLENFLGAGILIRTNARQAEEEEILKEVEQLYEIYQRILKEAAHRTVYTRLFAQEPFYLRTVRDTYMDELEEVITDDLEIAENLKEYFQRNCPEDLRKLRFYKDNLISLSQQYGIENCIKKALQEKVWLKSGAYLIIQPTEALVAIDVNTGKAIAGKQAEEETFFKINQEAAVEIAKQLRLRNLSGMVLIDFINMKTEEYREKLMALLRYLTASDPVKTTVVDMTKLNLVELTRKKEKRPLHEYFFDE